MNSFGGTSFSSGPAMLCAMDFFHDVDGRNPPIQPVGVGWSFLSHYLQWFMYPRWLLGSHFCIIPVVSAFVLAVLAVLIVDLSKGLATLPDNYTSVDPKQFKQIQIETCGLVKYLLEGVDDVFFLRSFFFRIAHEGSQREPTPLRSPRRRPHQPTPRRPGLRLH